jgi:hypothetical protein
VANGGAWLPLIRLVWHYAASIVLAAAAADVMMRRLDVEQHIMCKCVGFVEWRKCDAEDDAGRFLGRLSRSCHMLSHTAVWRTVVVVLKRTLAGFTRALHFWQTQVSQSGGGA